MGRYRTLMMVGGGVLLVLGSCATLLSLMMLTSVGQPFGDNGEILSLSSALCPLVVGIPFDILGGALIYVGFKQRQREKEQTIEAKVLSAAIARNYRVTPAEVAMLTDLSLSEAQAYLETLARSGQISVENDESGMLVYNFRR